MAGGVRPWGGPEGRRKGVEKGLVVGRAAWDSARSRMPFASVGQDIGQAIKSALPLLLLMVQHKEAEGAWQA